MSLAESKLNEQFDLKKIKNILGKERYRHTMLVLQAAVKIATNLNIEVEKVEIAALLHDIAKEKKKQKN